MQAIGAAVNGDRRMRELWHFGCEGYLGKLTREHAEKLAELEAELEVTVDGETMPFRMIRPDDGQRARPRAREQLDRAMWEATEEHLNPVYLDGVEVVRRDLPSLGVSTYVELYERFGFRLRSSPRSARPSSPTPSSSTRSARPRLARAARALARRARSAGTCSA